MRKSTAASCAFLVLAGLVSAAVSAVVPLLAIGLVYGIALALYFFLMEGHRNVLRIAAFIVSSTSAFLIAFFLAFFLAEWVSATFANATDSTKIPTAVFECAGFVGSYLVLAAGLSLFGPRNPSWSSWLRLLIWAIGGAVLGGFGATAGGTFIGSPSRQFSPYLFWIWQPGVALLLGLMLASERRLSIPHDQEIAVTESSPSGLSWSRLVPGGVVLAVLFGFLGWFGIREIQSKTLVAHLQQAYQRRLAEAPPLTNLPLVEAIPPEQVLIVREIAGLQPSKPDSHASSRAGVPPTVEYDVSYDLAERLSTAHHRPVSVEVWQMPNAAWSRYRLEQWGEGRADLAAPVTKFNSRVIRNTVGPIIGDLCYDWTSANFIIAVCYEAAQPEEQVINQYLQKYPSSL